MLSATASISSILLPKKVRIPCITSIKQPKDTAMSNMVASQRNVRTGFTKSQKKVNPPNNKKCTHLSASGTSTLGKDVAGAKQPTKISKVHNIAMDFACFLYGDAGVNNNLSIRLCPYQLLISRCIQQCFKFSRVVYFHFYHPAFAVWVAVHAIRIAF